MACSGNALLFFKWYQAVLTTNFQVQNGVKVSNYGRIITAKCRHRRDIFYVVSDVQIIQSPTSIVGQGEIERNTSVPLFVTTTLTVEISTGFMLVQE
jgi:hypothetical protein